MNHGVKHHGIPAILALPLLCLLCASVAESASALQIRIIHQARSIQPGEVVRLKIASPQPLKRVEGRAFERVILFYSEQSPLAWHGLLGIDLDTKPGSYPVKLSITRMDGTAENLTHRLAVRNKVFPTRHLTVDEKFVNPPGDVLSRIREEAERVQTIYARVSREKMWRASFAVPVSGPANSSFGKRSILNGQPRSPHSGTDFSAEEGTPVRAPNAGKVVLADNLYYSGNTVIIDHGLGLYSYFAHLSRFTVSEGSEVRRRQVIGHVGATGRVTGPHLHWSVRLAGARVDPLSLMAALAP